MPETGPGAALTIDRGTRRARVFLTFATAVLSAGLIALMARGLAHSGPGLDAAGAIVLVLFGLSVVWTAVAAGVALLGLHEVPRRPPAPPAGWRPESRTAILVLICGEPPAPVADALRALRDDLDSAGLGRACEIFVLSDSSEPAHVAAEMRALAPLRAMAGLHYRRRAANTGRKPGNIADWLRRWGGGFDHMIVLDADSRMSARRIGALVHRMECAPRTGLIQSGMRLRPARTRFGALQRLSSRLCGPGFGRGFAAWTGSEGNYWGHNAILRTAAFADAAALPSLPGRAPFGGDILSHDFIEAAWLRRAGWAVELDPDSRGSFEDGPQTLDDFHRRDRRWCQGNLQHIRLLGARGLHPVSRLHLASGIHSYLAAPIWLAMVLTIALTRPGLASALPLIGGLGLLGVPKLAGAWLWLRRAHGRRQRRRILRAALAEIALTSLLAPILLVRQSASVAAVLAGRDCGWRPAARSAGPGRLPGAAEMLAGVALTGMVAPFISAPAQIALLSPVLLPLLAAPAIIAGLEQPLRPLRWTQEPERAATLPAPGNAPPIRQRRAA